MSWEKFRRQPWHELAANPPEHDASLLPVSPSLIRHNTHKLVASPATPLSRTPTPDEDEETMNTKPNFLGLTKTPYSFSQNGRCVLFGLSVGALTGAAFGFTEAMRSVQENKSLKSLSNKGKGSFILNGVSKSAGVFGSFFASYHMLKYLGRTYVDPGDIQLIAACSAVSLGAVAYKPATRQIAPYATLLIAMDSFNELYRDKAL